ncbi:MAG: putative lipid II flippase FtsW [Rhodospirillales bacterium]|jgi:cell division protein FtsW|nr:putative lipid II flippase FtsW [Rhodospirillales bacterium]
MNIGRTDTSVLGRWWWTVDRWTLTALILIAAIGAVLTLAASPPAAERIGLDTYHFARRQFVYLPLALVVMIGASLVSIRGVRRLSTLVFAGAVILMVAVLLFGAEIKGATRWLHIGAVSLQPSEFIKPSFAVLSAWMFAEQRLDERFPGYAIATGLFVLVAFLLLMQPDVGMTIVISAIWAVQFFVAGLPLAWVAIIAAVFLGAGVGAYFIFGHVQARIDRFFDPAAGEGYQVMQGLEAFRNGGLFGRGPGEGDIKAVLPDAHTDFIFAVAGEEFGLLVCLLIVVLFAFVVLRGFARILREENLFIVLAVAGLLVLFGLQAIINMASSVHLMPPKGMTLPFISYGGSSIIALALTMGIVLALTRSRPGQGGDK